MLCWGLLIRFTFQWRTACYTHGQILAWEWSAPGAMKKLLYVPPCVITYLLIIMLIRQHCRLSEGKAMIQHRKERTNYSGNKMAFPRNYLAQEGKTGSREGVGTY